MSNASGRRSRAAERGGEEQHGQLDSIEEAGYQELLDLMPDAVFVQIEGRFAYMNPAAVSILGATSSGELLGTPIIDRVHPDHRASFAEGMRAVDLDREPMGARGARLIRCDAAIIDVETQAVPVVYNGHTGVQVVLRDVTQCVRAERQLGWTTAILESSEDAIYTADLHGIIVSWNPAAERIYGYPTQEVVGRPVDYILQPEERGQPAQRVAALVAGERLEHFEARRRRKDGSFVDLSITLSPIFDRTGTIVGVSAIARDIGERKRLERARDEFLSVVSHELRTPLTTLHGYAQMLSDTQRHFDAKTVGSIGQALLERTDAMCRLVEQLLDAQRLRLMEGPLALSVCDTSTVIHLAVTQAPEGERRRVVVEAAERPLNVECDERWAAAALAKLVDNALKYSDAEVTIHAEPLGRDVAIRVTDRGRGLSCEELEWMFDPFVQADMSSTRPFQGVGLGLYVARRVAELHGGRVEAVSEPGKGSTFSLVLRAAGPMTPETSTG